MPLLWDIGMSIIAGFAFSSLKPLIENKFKRENFNDKLFFVLGLLFNQLVIVLVSVWVYTEIDPNWIMLYWIDPKIFGTSVHIIYAFFPFFNFIPYEINKSLQKSNLSRYSLLTVASCWIILTLIILPDFIVIFKGSDIATHGTDYPAQYLWELISYPNKNVLWFIPMDLGLFFFGFFIIVIVFLILFELLGLIIAWKEY